MREIPLTAIDDAARSIYGPVVRTPTVRLDWPFAAGGRAPGAELHLTLETLQPVGSFKIRGAQNAVRQLPADALREGVWTVSPGNAAPGVALAARLAGARRSVFVIDTALAVRPAVHIIVAPLGGQGLVAGNAAAARGTGARW